MLDKLTPLIVGTKDYPNLIYNLLGQDYNNSLPEYNRESIT